MPLGDMLTMPFPTLLLAAIAILLLDRYLSARRLAAWVALAGTVIAAVLSLISFASGQGGAGQGMLAQDGAAVLSTLFLCGTSGAIALFDASSGDTRAGRSALGLFAILGGTIVAWATHLLTVLIGLGTIHMAVGGRLGKHRGRPWLLLHGVGLACVTMGVVLLYGGTGSMRLDVLLPRLERQATLGLANPLVHSGLGLILGGAILGLGLVPFHGWLPDACRGIGRGDGMLLSPVMPGISLLLLMRLRAGYSPRMMGLLATLGAWSIVTGYAYALRAGRLRAAQAGLAIAQSGRMAMALGLGASPASLFYHLLAGGLALLILWTTTDSEAERRSTPNGNGSMSAAIAILALLSLAGMLPLPGGVSSLLLWETTWTRGHLWDVALLLPGALMGWLFAGRWVCHLWRRSYAPEEQPAPAVELSVVALAATLILLLSGASAPLILTRFAGLVVESSLTS